VIKRRITGLVLAALWFFFWIYQGWPLRIVFTLLMGMGMFEMCRAFSQGKGFEGGVGCAVFTIAALPVYEFALKNANPFYSMGLFVMLAVLCMMISMSILIFKGDIDYGKAMSAIVPVFYPGLFFALMYPLIYIGGRGEVMLALGMAVMIPLINDLMAYEVGSLIGKHKLAPKVSPKKTVEGSVAGFISGIVMACALPYLLHLVFPVILLQPFWEYLVLGAVVCVASQLGDLSASYIKRACNIKDYGSLLPGHGGIMDRLDAVIFGAAFCSVFYFILR